MIDQYTAQIIARTEHQLMTQSLAAVPEYGSPMNPDQPGWLSKHLGELLRAVGNGLVSHLSNREAPVSAEAENIPMDGHELA